MNALEGGAKVSPLARGQNNFKAIPSFHKGVQNQTEVCQGGPQLPTATEQRGNDLRDALVRQEVWQGHPNLIKAAPFKLHEINLTILSLQAIDGGVHTRTERQEIQLAGCQAVGFLQAGEDELLGKLSDDQAKAVSVVVPYGRNVLIVQTSESIWKKVEEILLSLDKRAPARMELRK